MKQHDPPKGQFKTRFNTLFNYEALGDTFRLTLPEGRTISIKGKVFSRVSINLIPDKTSSWKVDPKHQLVADLHIKRKELMHEVTKPQLQEIYDSLEADFNTFWTNDLFIAGKYHSYRRYGAVLFLLSEREAREADIQLALNRIKEINTKLTEYL